MCKYGSTCIQTYNMVLDDNFQNGYIKKKWLGLHDFEKVLSSVFWFWTVCDAFYVCILFALWMKEKGLWEFPMQMNELF